MFYEKALRVAKRTLVDGTTLAELKQALKDLRAHIPNSALADLADTKIRWIENQHSGSHS